MGTVTVILPAVGTAVTEVKLTVIALVLTWFGIRSNASIVIRPPSGTIAPRATVSNVAANCWSVDVATLNFRAA